VFRGGPDGSALTAPAPGDHRGRRRRGLERRKLERQRRLGLRGCSESRPARAKTSTGATAARRESVLCMLDVSDAALRLRSVDPLGTGCSGRGVGHRVQSPAADFRRRSKAPGAAPGDDRRRGETKPAPTRTQEPCPGEPAPTSQARDPTSARVRVLSRRRARPCPASMKPVHARPRRTRASARRGRLRPPPRPIRVLTRPTRVDPPRSGRAQSSG
jgi:hypothetical protein